jgi:hypothetical protein
MNNENTRLEYGIYSVPLEYGIYSVPGNGIIALTAHLLAYQLQ